jgi:hypothetical protein
MKKMFTLLSAVIVSTAFFAQVTVTYQVDITDYLADGATLSPDGIRIGGNFADLGTTVAQWSPSDASAAMTLVSGNVWSISIVYPENQVGEEQFFKFVNGDWGTNEGAGASSIADDGCGLADNDGNINRRLIIPAADATVCFDWDTCDECETGSIENNKIASLSVFPNPATDVVTFEVVLNNASTATVKVMDLTGRVIATETLENNQAKIDVAHLAAGTYMYEVVAGNAVTAGRFIKK